MPVRIFLSTVSDEFRAYRDQLRGDFTRHNVDVKVQEDFKDYGLTTLGKLDTYITECDAVVHLVGDMTGAWAGSQSTKAIVVKYPDILDKLPPLKEAANKGVTISYTQWEAWLALYHDKPLLIALAKEDAPRGPNYVATEASKADQRAHLERLRMVERYPGFTFTGPDNLAKGIAYTVILDLLAKERRDDLQIGLLDSLVDVSAMAFVDVMRLTCVAGSNAARAVNQSRYQEFVDVADLHISEFRTELTRILHRLDPVAAAKCQEVERNLGWAISRLRRDPILDRKWSDFIGELDQCANKVHQTAELISPRYYRNKSANWQPILQSFIINRSSSDELASPDKFVRMRFSAQFLVTDELQVDTVRDDFDRKLAIPYFLVDFTLLRMATVPGGALRPLG